MLSSSCQKTLERKLLSAAIFGAVSGAFFLCFFGLPLLLDFFLNTSSRADAVFIALFFALLAVPAATAAFLVTPGKDKHIETCSRDDALIAGAGMTILAYTASLAVLLVFSIVQTPPADLTSFIGLLSTGLAYTLTGAVTLLPFAIPFGMFGGWLYRRLAKRTLSVA